MKRNLVLSILMYVISFLFLGYFCIGLFFMASEIFRLFILCMGALFLYFGGYFLSKYLKNNRPMKINLYIFFVLYLIFLIYLTLFDVSWLRSGFDFFNFDNLADRVNLIPFHTIFSFINDFDSLISTKQIFLNLFGNIFAFMPMALFLPLFFKKQGKIGYFIITLVIIILGIETVQLITGFGRFDVDDLILNLFGAVLAYLVLNIRYVRDLIHNIFLLEGNKISRIEYIKIIGFIMIAFLLLIILVLYRNKLYNQSYEDYNKIHNPNIEFIYDDDCTQNNLFYEDEVYKYYFKCYDSADFYVLINGSDKLSIKDFLDNSNYSYDISRLTDLFDINNIDYEIENKYEHFDIQVSSNNLSMLPFLEEDIVRLVIIDKGFYDGKYNFEVNIIPKKSGEEVIDIEFKSSDDDGNVKLIVRKVRVIVDSNFNVSYFLEN